MSRSRAVEPDGRQAPLGETDASEPSQSTVLEGMLGRLTRQAAQPLVISRLLAAVIVGAIIFPSSLCAQASLAAGRSELAAGIRRAAEARPFPAR